MPTCCSNKLYSATFSMNGSILHQATPLALVFAGSLSEAGSAHTCNHSLSSFESNPTKTIQTWLARLFFTVRTGAIELESTRTRSLSIPIIDTLYVVYQVTATDFRELVVFFKKTGREHKNTDLRRCGPADGAMRDPKRST